MSSGIRSLRESEERNAIRQYLTSMPGSNPQIEREFGVPFPGRILDSSKWTKTALKEMPAEGRLNWKELFGREAPVILDLGCGNGRSTIGSALVRPDHDHLGV